MCKFIRVTPGVIWTYLIYIYIYIYVLKRERKNFETRNLMYKG